VYGVSALDCHGRIADRVVLGALGWAPGTRLAITGDRRMITVRADAEDQSGAQIAARSPARVIRSRVTPQGHVRLPAEVRHACGMAAGDRVLLMADPAAGVLRVVSPATLDDLVSGLTTSEPASHRTDGTDIADSTPERPRAGRVNVPSRREQR
jgi:bifunctional DNA-binding transcriptional regulator/antitoxin component of YhaV-PrlF toxin-antitoxin module